MNNFKKISLFVLMIAVLVTCKKESLPPSTTANQPVFSFSGSINSKNVTWTAGVDNYYMNSSYTQNADNVYNFMGTLQPTGTTNNSIQFIINDYKVSAKGAYAVIDTSLVPAYYSIRTPGGTPTSYSVTFVPILNSVPTSYLWNFGDGQTSNSSGPTHIYAHPGDYHTSFTADLPGCGSETDSNVYKMGTPNASTYIPLVTVNHTSGPPTNMTFSIEYIGTPKITTFNFGDDSTLTINGTISDTIFHQYANAGMYNIYVKVIDDNGNVSTYNEVIVTSGYPETCVNNYTTLSSVIADTLALSNVTINYTDGGGNVYTSNNSSQPGSSYFQVLSVSNYQNNLNNETTKMLKVQFSCLLYNGSIAYSASGTAVIAVAYK